MRRARERHARLTKPPGSLGRLEDLGVRLAGMLGRDRPVLRSPGIAVCAADHGVATAGVSAYPQEVTAQMVGNILAGGAAISVLASERDAPLCVLDVGVAADLSADSRLLARKIRRGSHSFLDGPALTADECRRAVEAGREAACWLIERDCDVLIGGEMGIGNSTSAAALTAALAGCSAEAATGFGSGVDAAGRLRKIATVEEGLRLHRPAAGRPLELLARLGGLEIAALVGFYLQGAAARRVLLLDGFIATTAAWVATRLRPQAGGYMVAAHRSPEPGHRLQLEALGLTPLLQLDLRLGEGSGAALAFPLVQSAAAALTSMATFEEAGVASASG